MPKTRYVQIRVSHDQLERIRNNASAKGYRTVSHYARTLLLEKNLYFERKFDELYEEVMKISKKIN